MVEWLKATFGNKYLVTIITSMIPMLETRGAVTVATNLGMNPWLAFLISCLSALIICPFLLLLLKPILSALKKTRIFKKFAAAVELIFREKAEKIENEAKEDTKLEKDFTQPQLLRKRNLHTAIGIYLFVAIPLPMTGVWTGTAIAAFIDLKYRYSIPAIVLGNFTAGLIITILNIFLAEYSIWILLVLAIFMLISIISLIVGFVLKYNKAKKKIIQEGK
jgi:uncharacterized membrane protein